jgi:hypothetical protein
MATFTPAIVVDPDTGEELVSYDHGIFDSGEGRNAAIAHHMQSHQAQYVQDANGRIHHEFSDLDPARYQQYEQDYVDPDEYGQQFDQMELTENDMNYLQEIVGGSESYQEIIQWASNALTEEQIQEYDNIMSSGDVGAMEEAVRWLYEQFSNADPEDTSGDDFVDQVYDAIPNYDEVTTWAAENLSQDAIDEFNNVIQYGDTQLQAQFIDELVSLYSEAE